MCHPTVVCEGARHTFLSCSSFVACMRCSSCSRPSGISCDLHHSVTAVSPCVVRLHETQSDSPSILVMLYWICMARGGSADA